MEASIIIKQVYLNKLFTTAIVKIITEKLKNVTENEMRIPFGTGVALYLVAVNLSRRIKQRVV